MLSLIARLGSAHLSTGGGCQWDLRNVTLKKILCTVSAERKSLPMAAPMRCRQGGSAVELLPSVSGQPGVDVGLEQGWGLCWHPLQQQCQSPSLTERLREQRCSCRVPSVSRRCNSCGHHQLRDLQPPWSPSGRACMETRRKLPRRWDRCNFIAWGSGTASQICHGAPGLPKLLVLSNAPNISAAQSGPWTRLGPPGITRAVPVWHHWALGTDPACRELLGRAGAPL